MKDTLEYVDLSGITSLEGSLKVLATLPKLQVANLSFCPALTGNFSVFEKCGLLREVKRPARTRSVFEEGARGGCSTLPLLSGHIAQK